MYYETVLGTLDEWRASLLLQSAADTAVWMPLMAYLQLMQASTAHFFEHMLGTLYFVLGQLDLDLHVVFLRYHQLSKELVMDTENMFSNFNHYFDKVRQL